MQNTHIHKALVEKEMAGRQNGNSVPVTEKAEKKNGLKKLRQLQGGFEPCQLELGCLVKVPNP